MKEIIEQMKDDILNGEELQYNYEIDGVNVTVLADDFPWVRILAGGCEWETYVGNEHYDGLSLDDTLAELDKFIEYESIKSAIKDALKDKFRVKECADCFVMVYGNGFETTIQYQNQDDKIVTVTVGNQDLVDDEDGIITKVAEFFVNY
jgi:glycerophosphoryl diester phosphodiesterase